jgi:aryl-alcohol dehydrogenase-like predicted oxidoreductase
MEHRPLGSSSLKVSVTGLGCNNLGRVGTATEGIEGTVAVVDAAIEAGITFFDTADIYGKEFGLSERLLGEALRGRREGLVIATKFGHDEFAPDLAGDARKGSRAYIRAAVEGSLSRLGVDRLDLLQLHTPDHGTPIAETLAALDELVREGVVTAIGCSNFSGAQLREADAVAREHGYARFVSVQNEYNLLTRGDETDGMAAAEQLGISYLPWFPLANGLFTGKFTRTDRPADSRIARQRPHIAENAPWDAMEALEAFCAERGIGMLDATFGWLLAHPPLASVIAGATRPEQVRANAAAGNAWRPDEEERAEIDALFPRG